MKKMILVDGNNLIFRSYYATAYSGSFMKNSKDFPTNALYGLTNMINKIIKEENPEYMVVAFDVGKNFRHDKYEDYKAGRKAMPDELRMQFPLAKEILKAMGITVVEKENYEADDIIGTFVKKALEDKDFNSTVVSSDKDLLQLINYETDVKLLKKDSFIRYDEETFIKDFGIKPIRIIDMKAIAGDPSDNIIGVRGIGDKGALSLLQKYESLENIYNNIEEIKGKTQEKLINDKDNAFFSKELATIYCDVPLDIELDDTKIKPENTENLTKIFEDLEFYSFLKNRSVKTTINDKILVLNDASLLDDNKTYSFYIECDEENYHNGKIISMSLSDDKTNYYVPMDLIKDVFNKINFAKKYTFDNKKNIILLNKIGVELNNVVFDTMIAAYLLENNNKDDISYLMNNNDYKIEFYEAMKKKNFENIEKTICLKARYIFDSFNVLNKKIISEGMESLFYDIEMPLVSVLAKMEIAGIKTDITALNEMASIMQAKLEIIEKEIFKMVGHEFNVGSFRQLGVVLFEELGLPYKKKKNEVNYSTDSKVLHNLINKHPIIQKIMEYRNLSKLLSTYLLPLPSFVKEDEKIHTIYKQTLTRTGRLSSVEPNLQNIPIREELGRKVRKAFIPENDLFITADYSQIELRILAHITKDEKLIKAFNDGEDIHAFVASDIFEVPLSSVTKEMRRTAKAVIFGIVYGISGFGLGENLSISMVDAKKYIDKYLELYPKVKLYMNDVIKFAHENSYVETLFHRKRMIPELTSPVYTIRSNGERIALNTPIQGTGADILKLAMIAIDKEMQLRNLKSKMILQIHDELTFDVFQDEKEVLEKLIKDKMENIYKLLVPLKVEIDSGLTLYELK